MSYTKQTWATGDTITADKLNHIEAGIEESENKSFSVVKERTLLCEGSAETGLDVLGNLGSDVYQVGFSNTSKGNICDAPEVAYDEMMITINGTEYLCKKNELDDTSSGDVIYYGDNPVKLLDGGDPSDISQFVFAFPKPGTPHLDPVSILLINGSAFSVDSSHIPAIKIESYNKTITPTDDFKEAVKEANPCYSVGEKREVYYNETGITTFYTTIGNNIPAYAGEQFPGALVLDVDELIISIDGTEYSPKRNYTDITNTSGAYFFGTHPNTDTGWDENFPFTYGYYGDADGGNLHLADLRFQTEGPHDVKIESVGIYKVFPTEDFKEAVKEANPCYGNVDEDIVYFEGTDLAISALGDFGCRLTGFPDDLMLDNDQLIITVNGTEYQLDKHLSEYYEGVKRINIVYYGENPFDITAGETLDLPFSYLYATNDGPQESIFLVDGNEQSYDVKIEGHESKLVIADDFKEAVADAVRSSGVGGGALFIREIPAETSDPSDTVRMYDKTAQDIFDAIDSNMLCYLIDRNVLNNQFDRSFALIPLIGCTQNASVGDYEFRFYDCDHTETLTLYAETLNDDLTNEDPTR